MELLKDKVALITGAARGIGKAIALKYASEGANIAFTDLVINEAAEETVKELEAFGVTVKAYASNAAEFEATQTVVDQVVKDFGRIDILINNAGVFFFNPYTETAMRRIELMLQLHVMTVAKLTRLFAADMVSRQLTDEEAQQRLCGRKRMKGYILNMSSMSAWMAMPAPLLVRMVSRSRSRWPKSGSTLKSRSLTTSIPFICS